MRASEELNAILQILKLPQYSYEKIISKIIDEIKHRELFSTI